MVIMGQSKLIEDIIKFSVEELGKVLIADRAFFVECNTEQNQIDLSFQWCSKSIKQSSLAFEKSFIDKQSWLSSKLNHDIIFLKSIDELNYDDHTYKRELEADDVISLVIIPLYEGSRIIGIVGSEFTTNAPSLPKTKIPLIQAIGNIIRNSATKRSLERELLESEERYRALFENSPFAIGVHQFGRIVYVNPACIKTLKAENESQLIGKSAMSIVHSDFQEIARKRIEKMAETKKTAGVEIEKFVCCNGDILDVEVVSNPVMLEGKIAFQVMFRNLTEEKQAEKLLKQSEMRLRTLFEDSIDAIYISTIEGQLIEVNQSFLDLFGYSNKFMG